MVDGLAGKPRVEAVVLDPAREGEEVAVADVYWSPSTHGP
jgi:hypothetical protein